MNLLQFKTERPAFMPVYKVEPLIVLSNEGIVLHAGDMESLLNLSSYYDNCTVEVRQHDLYLNDNSKVDYTKVV